MYSLKRFMVQSSIGYLTAWFLTTLPWGFLCQIADNIEPEHSYHNGYYQEDEWPGNSGVALYSSLLERLRKGGSSFEASSEKVFWGIHLQNNYSNINWKCGSSGTVPAL
jgi:hypothetical protein